MGTTLQAVEPLSKRIRAALKRSKEPDPAKIARRLQRSLTDDEREELVYEALEDRVYHEVQMQRSVALRGHGRREAAKRERAEREAAQTTATRAKQDNHLDAELRERMLNPVRQLQHAAAQAYRKQAQELKSEAIRLSLDSIYSDRVCIAGQWLMLADCEEHHLRTLAEEYTQRAVDLNVRGTYYLALADELAASGCRTVGEMVEAKR